MKVIDILNMDKQGIVCVSSFFGGNRPKYVQIAVDIDKGVITFDRTDSAENSACIDTKGRIFMPSWLRRCLPEDCSSFYVTIIDGEKVLVPATGIIIWAKFDFLLRRENNEIL